ncbi:hypothetical protein Hanom_Chr06g00500851 [Helianthus anomalus]
MPFHVIVDVNRSWWKSWMNMKMKTLSLLMKLEIRQMNSSRGFSCDFDFVLVFSDAGDDLCKENFHFFKLLLPTISDWFTGSKSVWCDS